VFWWFERSGQFLRYETRDAPGGGYELRVVKPDGSEEVENFTDSSALTRRQRDFERSLADEGWTGPHGWNL
jgi:hypothetical protein